MADLQPDAERQATPSIRGYAYQCYQTIVAWLRCGPDEEIRCEFAEDYDLVRRDSNFQVTDAELNQVKHQKQKITLNGNEAIELINNFFRHSSRNPTIRLKVRLCTIADRGKENQVDWHHAECGVDLWDRLKGRDLGAQEQTEAIATLRSFLHSHPRYSLEVHNFVAVENDVTFLSDFVDRISWDTGQLPYGDIEKEIRTLLSNRSRPIVDPVETRQTIDRLWRSVMDLMASDTERTLRKEDLEKVLSEETATTIDRSLIRRLTSDIGNLNERFEKIEEGMNTLVTSVASVQPLSGDPLQVFSLTPIRYEDLPPLPRLCAPREELVAKMSTMLTGKHVLWAHGSTGFGKTTMANLLVRRLGKCTLWFRLRNLRDFEFLARLHSAFKRVSEVITPVNLVVVLDDVSISGSDTNGIEEIGHIVDVAKRKDAGCLIIVTSQSPAPSRLASVLGEDLISLDMPAISEAEIASLLVGAGLTETASKGLWLAFIQARTQGHPQLVSAYVSYGKEIEWKLAPEHLASTPTTAETIKREARQVLSQSIPSPGARELAKRLSVVGMPFPRDLALFVAKCDPSVEDAGHAFDLLLGPWIEALESNYFSLSPLLEGYAAADVGERNLAPYNRMAAYGWFSKRKLNPSEFMQMVVSAILANEEFLIGHASGYILQMEKSSFKQLAKFCSLLPLIGLDDGSVIDNMQPITRYFFRSAQLRIAAANEQWTHYSKLDALIIKELELCQDAVLGRSVLFTHCLTTSVRKPSQLSMKERIRRSIKAVALATDRLVDPSFLELFEQKSSIGSVVLLATSTLDTHEDLDFMFTELERQPKNVISAVFEGFTGYPDLLTLLMDRVWLNESKKETPNWKKCLDTYTRIADFACAQGLNWLFGAAIRAQAIINDEYLNRPLIALEIVQQARTRSVDTHLLLDHAEATVRFRQEDYSAALEILQTAHQNLSSDILTMERIFSVRKAIISAAKLKLWDKVVEWGATGLELAKALPDKTFSRAVEIAFWGEIGWGRFEGKNRTASIEAFEECLKLLQECPDCKDPHVTFVQYRLGQVLGWLSGFASRETENRPYSGMFSDFADQTSEALGKRLAPIEGRWGMLAKAAAWFLPKDKVQHYADFALRATPAGQCYLGVWTAREGLFAAAMSAQDHGESLTAGLLYVKSFIVISLPLVDSTLERGPEWDIAGYGAVDSQALSPAALAKWRELAPTEIYEPVLMNIMSSTQLRPFAIEPWRRILVTSLGPSETIEEFLQWLETAEMVIKGDSDAIRKTKEVAWKGGQTPESQRLALIICCGSTAIDHATCLTAQLSFFNSLPTRRSGMAYGHAFTRMVAARWIRLAKEQRFLIGSPRLHAPAILQAASPVVPTFKECASLMLLVVNALRARMSDELLDPVKAMAQTN